MRASFSGVKGVLKINQNIILYDWLSFTSKIDSPQSIIKLLGLTDEGINWVSTYGMYGYKDRYYFNGISIHYNSANNDVFVNMSGTGCRAFEQYSDVDWSVIFQIIIDDTKNYNITRLDVAYDDFTGLIDIRKLYRETEREHFISKFKDPTLHMGARSKAITIDYGSQSSDIMMRCYDKAKEREAKTKIDNLGHWVRWEIQMRDDRAYNFLLLGYDNIGYNFFGLVNNYIRYIVPSKTDTNISRQPTAKWWTKWLNGLQQISVYTPKKLDYNLYDCERYVYRQAGNAIDALITIKGYDTVYDELQHSKPRQSIKYRDLINSNKVTDNDKERTNA